MKLTKEQVEDGTEFISGLIRVGFGGSIITVDDMHSIIAVCTAAFAHAHGVTSEDKDSGTDELAVAVASKVYECSTQIDITVGRRK